MGTSQITVIPPMRRSTGFSLLEIVVVVGIVAILVAIAYPYYRDNSKRARMAEVVMAGTNCRASVSEAYQNGNRTPGWGCNAAPVSRYVSSVAAHTVTGVVTITATGFNDPRIDGKSIILTPYHDDTTAKNAETPEHLGKPVYKWVCGPAPQDGIPLEYLPSSCRG